MDNVDGFNHSGVFQTIFVVGHKVYRLFPISYNRQRAYDWSRCNYGLIPEINRVLDETMEEIGQSYDNLKLSENLEDLYVEQINRQRTRFVLSHSSDEANVTKAEWKVPEFEDLKEGKSIRLEAKELLQSWIKIITVSEGDNRCADYSSKAWAANRLKHRYGLEKQNAMELHWIACLVVSPLLYMPVLNSGTGANEFQMENVLTKEQILASSGMMIKSSNKLKVDCAAQHCK